ncbi:MAG: alginate export family protein, partial [Planctomycetes bacterium]|nr:alginate export family protein [Planctomycetota bacterium]
MTKESRWTIFCAVLVIAVPAAAQSDYFSTAPVSMKSLSDVIRSVGSVTAPDDFILPHRQKGRSRCKSCRKTSCGCGEASALDKAIAGSHKGVFYDNNFDYLCDPGYDQWWPGDRLKRLDLWGLGMLDIGGQYRIRLHNERHLRGFGLTGNNDDFLLHRLRLYANLQLGDRFRVFAEMLDAHSAGEDFAPLVIEENRIDLQNAFVDLRVWQGGCGDLWVRAGRQELLYGAQRTFSPLDWANTRRTFEGYKVFWKGQNWNVDAFYARPMRRDVNSLDSANYDREFMGFYSTYKGAEDATTDLYYLRFNDETTPFQFDTLGARFAGSRNGTLWDFEAAYQWGEFAGVNHSAGAYTLGVGWKSDCHPWKTTVWSFYDWASGSSVANNGYHHLFPLVHKYFGFMDLFGRRNIKDWNTLVTISPHKKLKLLMWYHVFELQTILDTPYNINMTAFNAGSAPGSTDLGR